MKRAIVTGATSMLGLATIRECIKNDVEVWAISRAGSRRRECMPKSGLLRFTECDLAELKELQSDGGKEYDVLYHFGWGFTDKSTRDDPFLQIKNVEYTLDAVELARRSGCHTFVGAGSQAEYGRVKGIISEDTPCNPEVSYGVCKLAAGRLAAKLCREYGMKCIWTRTFSAFGTCENPNGIIAYAVSCFLKKETAEFSAGRQQWDFLFEDDAAAYFYLLGNDSLCGWDDGKTGTGGLTANTVSENQDIGDAAANMSEIIVNIAAGDRRTLREYIEEMAAVFGQDFQYHLAEEPAADALSIEPDVTRLRKLTGYRPQVSFADGLRKIVAQRREAERLF